MVILLHTDVEHSAKMSNRRLGATLILDVVHLAGVIEQAGDSVKKGAALSAPLGDSGLFPPTIVDMIAVAEESNNLETVLVQIAETNETRTARQIDLGVRVLEPILLVVMASLVFCILVAILLPILTMGSAAV